MSGDYKIDVIIDGLPGLARRLHVKGGQAGKSGLEGILREVARRTIEVEGITESVSLNLLLTDNKRLRELNRRFLNRDARTDVIAFGAKGGERRAGSPEGFIGEVAISVEMAGYNAKRFHTTFKKELFLYIIHGVLHLVGYSDETSEQQRIMQKREKRILEAVCGSS